MVIDPSLNPLFDRMLELRAKTDKRLASLEARVADLEATPQPVEVRVVDASRKPE